jgi:hypothetical protein
MKLNPLSLRIELKFKVPYSSASSLFSFLNGSAGFNQSYPDRVVSSLYFDTVNYDFAYSNLSGESRRIKARFRWYEKLHAKTDPFFTQSLSCNLEIKRKLNGCGDKLSILNRVISLAGSPDNLINELTSAIHSGSGRLVSSGDSLIPSVFITYNRKYFELNGNSQVRITVDSDICYSSPMEMFSPSLMSNDFFIVELKFPPSASEFISDLLSSFGFRCVRYSKYLAGFCKLKNIPY